VNAQTGLSPATGRLPLPRTEPGLPPQLSSVFRSLKDPPSVVPIVGDASTRSYFRALYPDGKSAILMVYPDPGKNEEAPFLDVQRFLQNLGMPVPRVLAVHPNEGVVILEDLGDELLEKAVHQADELRVRNLYGQAVDVLIRMRRATATMRSGCVAFGLAFDEVKLMQEMQFFMTHFVRGLCRTEPSPSALAAIDTFFTRMCTTLAAEPRIFTHRDYHSRNLILQGHRLVMIDFQDARMGPPQYDLASLLRDSYVTLPDNLVEELLGSYFQEAGDQSRTSSDRFRYIFDLMCLQRNIKALGTFGYQFSVRRSTRYLSSIPRTGAYIAANISERVEFSEFRPVVEELISGPASSSFGTTTD
jgi:N-acetylmuramate 1-kinase